MDPQIKKHAFRRQRRLSRGLTAVCGLNTAEDSTQLIPEGCAAEETESLLFALALAVEQRDRHTAGHCERMAFISVALGMALRLSRASLMALYRGSFLHDVGKVGIPDSILFKPGKLSAAEWVVMRSHATRGEEICRHLKSLAPVIPIIRHHHERWDGSGYPDGLRQSQIPLLARVVQIADIYDALTSPRPYKPAYSAPKALRIIADESGRGWRDPELVEMFFNVHKGIVTKIAYYDFAPDGNLISLRNSLTELQTLMDAVA